MTQGRGHEGLSHHDPAVFAEALMGSNMGEPLRPPWARVLSENSMLASRDTDEPCAEQGSHQSVGNQVISAALVLSMAVHHRRDSSANTSGGSWIVEQPVLSENSILAASWDYSNQDAIGYGPADAAEGLE